MTAIAFILAFALCIVLAWALHLQRVQGANYDSIQRLYGELDQARATIEELEDQLSSLTEGAIEHEPHSNGGSNGSETRLH